MYTNRWWGGSKTNEGGRHIQGVLKAFEDLVGVGARKYKQWRVVEERRRCEGLNYTCERQMETETRANVVNIRSAIKETTSVDIMNTLDREKRRKGQRNERKTGQKTSQMCNPRANAHAKCLSFTGKGREQSGLWNWTATTTRRNSIGSEGREETELTPTSGGKARR